MSSDLPRLELPPNVVQLERAQGVDSLLPTYVTVLVFSSTLMPSTTVSLSLKYSSRVMPPPYAVQRMPDSSSPAPTLLL